VTADDLLCLWNCAEFLRPGLLDLLAADLAATPTGELRSAWVRAGFSPRTFRRGAWAEKIRERAETADRVDLGRDIVTAGECPARVRIAGGE
jgi:hypothetical protein